jgi:cytochrome P450
VDVSPAALDANPYPVYRRLRESAPVAYAPALEGRCLIARWDDVETVLKDDGLFSARIWEPADAPENLTGSLLFLDGEEHDRIRTALQPACQPRRAVAFADRVISSVADDLLDRLAGSGEGELVDRFFAPLTAAAVARLVGLGPVTVDELRDWVEPINSYLTAQHLPSDAHDRNARFDDALRARLRELGTSPPDEDVSILDGLLHRDGGAPLTEREILTNVKIVAAAGFGELRDLMAHTLLGLLSRPDQLDELRTDPSLARTAFEEGARWSSPVGMVTRTATADAELGGVRIPGGTKLAALLASANRDEDRWTDGGRFDLHREEGMHLAFASGVHFCLGAWVARATGAIALQRLVERLPGLRLKQGAPLVVSGWRFRVVHRLPAAWS